MIHFKRILAIILVLGCISQATQAQVNAVTFGKNRLQYQKFNWKYYQTDNFNVYFTDGGQELAKYVLQVAEKELPQIENAAEYSLQRRANIVVYNSFKDVKQTNIGLETPVFTTGGFTQLVNNKMVVYFNANHADLRRQVRQGIADVLTKNILFGDNISEVASNQNLLDIPQYLIDGYTAYLGENWSTDLDDDLRSEILSSKYTKFKSLAFQRPLLAGHAFWYFIEEKYKKENVTYLFYLMRTYKNVDRATRQVTKLKMKHLMAQFMEYSDEKYSQDVRRRKNYPKGSTVETFEVNKRKNYFNINVNPNKRNNSYVLTKYDRGIVRVILSDGYDATTLLKYGVRQYESQVDHKLPLSAWDPKGTRVAVVYNEEGRLKLFVWDVERNYKSTKLDLTDKLDQIQDAKFMLNSNTLLLSAVKNGWTDLYSLKLDNEVLSPITNDVYDDIDASFVAFPNKHGILFASNRPNPAAKSSDTTLPSDNRYNVFMITDFGDKPELNQITQLTQLKYGNARYPTQYNNNHFTFVADENGIANRFAGFFVATNDGLDTLVLIGDDILRNPSQGLIDSTLRANNKTETDSIAIVSVTTDSSFTFPLSNYPSNLQESRVAGDNQQVSEVTRQSDEKILYKLKIDENTLRRRNISAPPTAFGKKMMRESQLTSVKRANVKDSKPIIQEAAPTDSSNLFQSEFDNLPDSIKQANAVNMPATEVKEEPILNKAKLYNLKPFKFSIDYGSAGVNGMPIYNRYQPYMGGSGPIRLSSSTALNGMVQLGTSDLLEDYKFIGAYRLGTNLKDNEWFVSFQNYRRYIDWGLSFYRNVVGVRVGLVDQNGNMLAAYPGKMITNLYQGNASYPLNEAMSIRLTTGIRNDRTVISAVDSLSAKINDQNARYAISKLEFVVDNVLNPATNIWNGFRAKAYIEYNRQINTGKTMNKPNMFVSGLDARYYYPIYRNFIWAGRVAADFSWGNQKVNYFLGGMDGWLMFGNNTVVRNGVRKDRFFNTNNAPDPDQYYAFQSLAVNMRGYIQNIASGNNNIILNSEFRLPVWSTLFDRVVSNAFLNNLQFTQFIDLGTAWNGRYDGMKRPSYSFTSDNSLITVRTKTGGVGPFAGGYGFGVRSSLLGYFLKLDAGWPMNGFFKGKPVMYLSMGLDF